MSSVHDTPASLRAHAKRYRDQAVLELRAGNKVQAKKLSDEAGILEMQASLLDVPVSAPVVASAPTRSAVRDGGDRTRHSATAAKPATKTGILTTLIQKSWKWIFLVALITLAGNIISAGAARFLGVVDYFSWPWGWLIKWASLNLITSMMARFSVGEAATVISVLSLASCVFGFLLGTTIFLWLPGYFWMKNKLFNHK